ARGHERRTHGDVQRGHGREPATVADGRPEHESEPVQTCEQRRANGVPGGDVDHDAPIRYLAEWRVVECVPAEDQVATEVREDERGADGFGPRAVTERGSRLARGRVWGALRRSLLGPGQKQRDRE